MICEENSTDANDNQVILNVYPMMKGEKKKMEKLTKNASKSKEKECQYYKKSIKKRWFWNPNNPKNKLKEKHEIVVDEVVATPTWKWKEVPQVKIKRYEQMFLNKKVFNLT